MNPIPKASCSDIVRSIDVEHGHGAEPLFQAKYKVPLFLAISIAMFNQLSGINAILYYLNDIFLKAGFSRVSGDLQSVMIGVTNLIFTMAAMTIIDKVGRRTLLLIGSVGCTIALAGVATVFLSGSHEGLLVWCLVLFIASFAFSQGAVIWVYISEVFPNRVRGKGQSLGSFTHWIMNAASHFCSRFWRTKSRGLPFVFFACDDGAAIRCRFLGFPETKGVTLEEMQKKLGIA